MFSFEGLSLCVKTCVCLYVGYLWRECVCMFLRVHVRGFVGVCVSVCVLVYDYFCDYVFVDVGGGLHARGPIS